MKGDWGGDEIGMIFQDGATDNVYFTGNFDVRIQQLGNGSLVPPDDNNNPGPWEYQFYTWNQCYRKIRNCCRFLDHIDKAYFKHSSTGVRAIYISVGNKALSTYGIPSFLPYQFNKRIMFILLVTLMCVSNSWETVL